MINVLFPKIKDIIGTTNPIENDSVIDEKKAKAELDRARAKSLLQESRMELATKANGLVDLEDGDFQDSFPQGETNGKTERFS